MTRRFEGQVQCPGCHLIHTAETALERWIRGAEALDSRVKGIVRFDCDILLHRYKMLEDKKGARAVQCMMLVEGKTRNANVTAAQRDTLSMFSQVIRNRRTNIHRQKRGRHAQDHLAPAIVYSHILRRGVRLFLFGAHLLRMNGDDPTNSSFIQWDNTEIDEATLLRLLAFELDPDTLRPTDWRRRYSDFAGPSAQAKLPFME